MELYYKRKFRDVKEFVIPNTKDRVGRTEDENSVMDWMDATGHIPLCYAREKNGIHVECSTLFEARVKNILKHGTAVGDDGRTYTFISEEIFASTGDICVRAKAEDERYTDVYSLTYFL